jgi:hypothetical protein
MGVSMASGSTSHSGIYTPEIWSGKTLLKFYKAAVLADISNTDYEGEIKSKGDVVKIRTVPDITINDYEINQKLNYERPTSGLVELAIDKGKYYAVAINDVERIQSDINYVNKWSDDAGQQLAIEIDRSCLADFYADADAENKGLTAGAVSESISMGVSGTPLEVTKTNILEVIVDMGTILDEQNRPTSERFCVLPAIMTGLIKKSDLKDASLSGDGTSILRNGLIGGIDHFKIYSSNNLASVTDGSDLVFNVVAGHKSALTFASQLTKNETLKNPDDFGDLMRGLQVYGYKVIQPKSLIHGYFTKG